jgi:HD-like signal output (HDOD) protein/prolyl-tRNA editing enzyme YbaK/EbsC (Cys-tRNA(Pro) deacylase)
MEVPARIATFLERNQTAYDVLYHPQTRTLLQAAEACNLPLRRLARAVVLVDGRGLLMAVVPADHVLDFEAIGQLLQRDLEPMPAERLSEVFDDCEPGSCPPLGPAYGLDVLVDEALDQEQTIAFEPGSHHCLIQVSAADFHRLVGEAAHGSFSRPVQDLRAGETTADSPATLQQALAHLTPARVRDSLEEIHELPPLPATAQRILALRADPNGDARRLSEILEQDPPLAAQILRYANSALYGYGGSITDLKTAIARVLGFDLVLNLSLGLSIGSSLRVPADGPLGLEAFWRHSLYSARLVERIAAIMPRRVRPQRGPAYLAGLLQNLGTLVLGHTFPSEFFLLNRFVLANPHLPLCKLERHLLGVCHTQLGGWLLEAWGMPEELVVAVQEHHNHRYWDQHAVYPQLVLLANRLLKRYGLGDASREDLPSFSLQALQLEEAELVAVTEEVLGLSSELDGLAHRLAA